MGKIRRKHNRRLATKQEIFDELYRRTFKKDCEDPTGVILNEWVWFHLN